MPRNPSDLPPLIRRKLRRAASESAKTKFTSGGRNRPMPSRMPSIKDYSKPETEAQPSSIIEASDV